MPEIIFQTQRLYKIAGRRHRCIIILLRRAWLKIHHISMQARVPRGAAAFRRSCQLKGILIRDKQSAGILCFSISGLYSLNELWISERFLVEIWAPVFWSGKAMLPLEIISLTPIGCGGTSKLKQVMCSPIAFWSGYKQQP